MAENSLSPASIVIAYHSAYGSHRMTIPTKAWFPTDAGGTLGSYEAWDLSTVDAEAMVTDLCNTLTKFVPASVVFDDATIYTQADADAPNIPQRTASLAIAGVATTTNPSAAVSATFNFKTLENGNAKIVLLDCPFGSAWLAPTLPAGFTSDVNDVISEFTGTGNAWSGRDDARPNILRKITYDVNDKLQKMYFGS
jgi:hypothetical protein